MSSSEIAILARNVSKRYSVASAALRPTTLAEAVMNRLRTGSKGQNQEFWALRDVGFEIGRGEVVGIIGRNGAGKSTLLKILSQITSPTTGEIDVHGMTGSLLEVGTGFHPELTGRENIYLNGAILGMRRRDIDKQFDSIVSFAETEAFLDTPVKRYSSGMYVRLAFAVAAHLSPDILIVDEVLAVGDLAFQKKCLGKMESVARSEGRTVLFVSHNMAAVRRLCSRAILLKDGVVELDGEAGHVVGRYLELNSDESVATSELPTAAEDVPARGMAVRTLDAEGRPKSNFHIGESIRLRVEFEVRKELPHVIAAIGLRSLDRTPLITWWSAPADLKPGTYAVEFPCDLLLAAGELRFTVGISTEERTVYYVEDTGNLSIAEIAIGEQPFRASGCGVFASVNRPPIIPLVDTLP